MSDSIKVLFVCVHNAGRSQMAEALLRKLGGPRFDVASAGFEPRPVNPIVVDAMKLVDIDISGAKSKSVSNYFAQAAISTSSSPFATSRRPNGAPYFRGSHNG